MTARRFAGCIVALHTACWPGSAAVEEPAAPPQQSEPARTPLVAAPSRCDVEHAAPVGGFGGAVLRVEAADGGALEMIAVAGDRGMYARAGSADMEIHAAPGVYTLEAVVEGDKVRCTGIRLADGQVTTVRVRR